MKRQLLCICVSAALLAGCTGDGETTVPDHDGRVPLQVNSGIHVQTRAYDDKWETGDAIGIYMLNGETAESENNRYTTAADKQATGNFSAADGQTIYFPASGDARDFIAYYPWQDIPKGSTTYRVDVATQTPQQAIDLMGATKVTGKDKSDPEVTFRFTHKLVKLVLTIRPAAGMSGSDLQGLKVALTNQRTQATYDVLKGDDVTVDTGVAATAIPLKTAADGASAEGIVLPAADTADMLLTFTLSDGGTLLTWAVKDAPLSRRFVAGSKYLYTITIGKTNLEVTSTVTDWAPGNGSGESGSAQ